MEKIISKKTMRLLEIYSIGTSLPGQNCTTNKREIIAITECLESGWIVLTITDGERYLKPVYQFLIGIIAASLLILGSGFLISRILSRMITDPLKDLNHKISPLDWDKLDNNQSDIQMKGINTLT